MVLLTVVLLTLTLFLCGIYAGLAVMCQIAVLPTMRRVSLQTYAETWRIMDGFMDRAMPPYKLTLLIVTAATTACLLYLRRIPLAVAVIVSFFCSLIALVLTITKQLPVNSKLRNLSADADDSLLLTLREQTVNNFAIRLIFAIVSFAALSFGAAYWPVR